MADSLRFLEPEQVRVIERPGSVGLRIEVLDEQTILNAQVRRVFPLSKIDEFISIRDGAGKEIGVLKSLQGLDAASRDAIEHELERRYFTPVIETIEQMKLEAGMWRFEVRTQRGPIQFYVRHWRDNAHELSPNRWHINAVDGGRYEIKDVEALDEHSRRLMDQVL